MSNEGFSFRTGDLFEWHADIGDHRIELLAEMEIAGTVLHLHDLAIYPVGVEYVAVGLAPLLGAARASLFPTLRRAGFNELCITGTRLSGANPGRIVDVTIDLTREAT